MSNATDRPAIRKILDRAAALLAESGIQATVHGPTLFGFGFDVAPTDSEITQALLQRTLGRAGLTFRIRPRGESTRVFTHWHPIN